MHATLSLGRRGFANGLSALLFAQFVGCGPKDRKPRTESPAVELAPDFGRVRKHIRKAVQDKERRNAAGAELDRIAAALGEIDGHFRDVMQRYRALDWETRTSPEGTTSIDREFAERIGGSLREAARAAIELRKHITPDEWLLVFPSSET